MKQQRNVMRKTSVHWTVKELNLLFNMCEQSTPISEMAERLGSCYLTVKRAISDAEKNLK
jgi:hypothetical protein